MVSCILPIKRVTLVSRALQCYFRQDYPDRELVIYEAKGLGGAAMNEGCRRSLGDIICYFCDDDYSQPGRVRRQVKDLEGSMVTAFYNTVYLTASPGQSFERNKLDRSGEESGYSLCFRKEWWEKHPFDETIRLGYCKKFRDEAREAGVLNRTYGGDLIIAGKHPLQTSWGA